MLIDERLAKITITEGEDIITALHNAAAELCTAIELDVTMKRMLKDAETDLSAAEAELVMEANIAAKGGEGPLAGIAVTSKAYGSGLEVVLARAHEGELRFQFAEVKHLRTAADNANTAAQQAQTKFSATRHAADLKAAIIRAIAL